MSNADCPWFVLVMNRSIIKEEGEKAHKQGQGQCCGCLVNMSLGGEISPAEYFSKQRGPPVFYCCYLGVVSPSEPGLTWHGHQRGRHGLKTIVLLQRGREQIPLPAVVAQLSWKCSQC